MTQTQAAPLPLDTVRAVYADIRRQVAEAQCLLYRLARQYPGCEAAGEAASSAVIPPAACITGGPRVLPMPVSFRQTVREDLAARPPARHPAPSGRIPAPRAPQTPKLTAVPRSPGGAENPTYLGQTRQLPEPFTAVALGVALGVKGTGPNTLLKRWEDKGWVKRSVVRGQWSRTPTFGHAAPPAPAQSATAASTSLLATLRTPQAES